MSHFSDYIIYVDESGNHNLNQAEHEYPVFVLSFCIFRKEEYVSRIVPGLQLLKFKNFGHDMIVLHERDIRKATGSFAFLTDANRRTVFMDDLNIWVTNSPFDVIAVVIRKDDFINKHVLSTNIYHFAMHLGLERVSKFLRLHEPAMRTTHFVFEARGKREDNELELEFRRACDDKCYSQPSIDFHLVFSGKLNNSTGLQLADLTARPIGRYVMNPAQSNRAFDIIRTKLVRSNTGVIDGYGLNCYP